GAVRSGLKALFQSNGPLRIKPRLDPALWSWLWRFARRCNARDMLAAGHGIQALLNSSRRLYDELLSDEQIDCAWDAKGMLFVFQTKPAMEHYAHTDSLLKTEFGLAAKRIDDAAAFEPALKPGLAGAWHYDTDAHLRPDRLMTEWQRVLGARGVTIHEDHQVKSFALDGSKARAVVTDRGEFAADALVVATGA